MPRSALHLKISPRATINNKSAKCQILMPSVKKLNLGQYRVFQQNNDPKHSSKSTKKWLTRKKICVLDWPSKSPDLNSVKMLGEDLKWAVHARHPSKSNWLNSVRSTNPTKQMFFCVFFMYFINWGVNQDLICLLIIFYPKIMTIPVWFTSSTVVSCPQRTWDSPKQSSQKLITMKRNNDKLMINMNCIKLGYWGK